MELSTIKTQTTWSEVANTINQNNQKIEAALLNVNEKLRGYFVSETSLKNTIPVGKLGDIAYVFNTSTGGVSYYIYTWDGTNWVNTNQQYEAPDVNLNGYVKKSGSTQEMTTSLKLTYLISRGINLYNFSNPVDANDSVKDGMIKADGFILRGGTSSKVLLGDGSTANLDDLSKLKAIDTTDVEDYNDVF